MKKLLILFLLFSTTVAAQKKINAYIGCYGDKDTISLSYLKTQTGINLMSNTTDEVYWVASYELLVFSQGLPISHKFNNASFFSVQIENPYKDLKKGDRIIIQNIKIRSKGKTSPQIVESKIPTTSLFIGNFCSKKCKGDDLFKINDELVEVQLACFGDRDIAAIKDILKKPFLLLNEKSPEQKIELSSYFIYYPNPYEQKGAKWYGSKNDKTELSEQSQQFLKGAHSTIEFIHISDIVVTVTDKRNRQTFQRKLDPITIYIAEESDKQCDQPKETSTDLLKSNVNVSQELVITKSIYYDPNSTEILPESSRQIDEVIDFLLKNESLRLQINSHTDSNGEDGYNLELSQKRAQEVLDYIVSKGISNKRLSAKGFGEIQLVNRCKNGVDCSEVEHQRNRRTEFKFTK